MIDFFMEGGFNRWGVCIWPISEFVAVKYSAKNISLTLQGAGLFLHQSVVHIIDFMDAVETPMGSCHQFLSFTTAKHQMCDICLYIYIFFFSGASKSQKAARHTAR